MQAMQRVVLSWAQVMLAPVVRPTLPSCGEGPERCPPPLQESSAWTPASTQQSGMQPA